MIECDLNDLHEKGGYPAEIKDFDYSDNSQDIQACMNLSCMDSDRGIVLKLGEDKEVLAAMKGRKVLS
jgi:hypothetical protein